MEYQAITTSEDETLFLGSRLANLLVRGDVIAFFGDLGSGKTCFIKGICEGLGVTEYVTSPTFTLINEYSNGLLVYHFDFYRISSESEIYGLGYEEYFYGNGICLIEWADHVINFLPQERVEIHLCNLFEQGKENHRDIQVRIFGDKYNNRNWGELIQFHHLEG